MAEAANIPLVTYRGDSPIHPFVLKDSSGTAINIAGYTFKLTVNSVEEPSGAASPHATELFEVDGVVTGDGSSGQFTFQPTTTHTNQDPSEYYYDVSLVNGSEKVTLVKSTYTINQDIGKA